MLFFFLARCKFKMSSIEHCQCVNIPDFLLYCLLVLELYTESCRYHPAQSEGLFSSCPMAVIAPLPNSNYSVGAVAPTLAVSLDVRQSCVSGGAFVDIVQSFSA
jgi:hypothetical protein